MRYEIVIHFPKLGSSESGYDRYQRAVKAGVLPQIDPSGYVDYIANFDVWSPNALPDTLRVLYRKQVKGSVAIKPGRPLKYLPGTSEYAAAQEAAKRTRNRRLHPHADIMRQTREHIASMTTEEAERWLTEALKIEI